MAAFQACLPKDKTLDFQPAGSNFKESEACPALPSLASPGQQRLETKPDLPLTPSGQSLYCPIDGIPLSSLHT